MIEDVNDEVGLPVFIEEGMTTSRHLNETTMHRNLQLFKLPLSKVAAKRSTKMNFMNMAQSSLGNKFSSNTLKSYISGKSSERSVGFNFQGDEAKSLRQELTKAENVFRTKLKNLKPLIFEKAAEFVKH